MLDGSDVLTIFTTAKAFRGHSAVIQRNAFVSWRALRPAAEVIVFGDDEGAAEICAELGFRHVPDVATSSGGTPIVSDMFAQARELATGKHLCFVNADIILPPQTTEAIDRVAAVEARFLLVGRRIDVSVESLLDLGSADWYAKLWSRAQRTGTQRGDLCIDWFAFNRDLLADMPPFAVGRTRYDNWMIWKAADEGAAVVDATPFLAVLHQDHDYGHIAGSLNAWEGPEARRAEELLGHWSHYHSIAHATKVLQPGGELAAATGMRYRLARPRRRLAHLLRFSRPWRRRLRLALASAPRPRWRRPVPRRLRRSNGAAHRVLQLVLGSAVSQAAAARLAHVPPLERVPSWTHGDPRPRGLRGAARRGLWEICWFAGLDVPVIITWLEGLRLEQHLGNDLSRCVYVSGVFEPNELAFLRAWLRPGMTFVDVGANEGCYALLAAQLVGPEGQVIAIEPSPREIARLQRNLALNGLDRVTVSKVAILESEGRAVLRIADATHAGQNTFGDFIYSGVGILEETEVVATTLDSLLEALGVQRVDFVKIDVEGAERAVLRGSTRLLESDRPIIQLEVQERSLAAQGASTSDLFSLLEDRRYEILVYDDVSGRPARAGGAAPVGLNVLAVPAERVADVLGHE
jgi:FkbM family methyltransferase